MQPKKNGEKKRKKCGRKDKKFLEKSLQKEEEFLAERKEDETSTFFVQSGPMDIGAESPIGQQEEEDVIELPVEVEEESMESPLVEKVNEVSS